MKHLIIFAFTIFLTLAGIAQNFEKENKAYRKKINKEFRDSKESPLTATDFKTFTELEFFSLNETYRVSATLVVNTLPKFFKMPTTTDRMPVYSTYGELIFTLQGKEYRLQVYQNQKLKNMKGYEDYLFVPFTDETNGAETYGGGRYLDFRIPTTEQVTIDFNQAYNPYCAYSERYSCPKVPEVNNLTVRIEAGVKNWGH